MSADAPYAVCPKCLFSGALHAAGVQETEAGEARTQTWTAETNGSGGVGVSESSSPGNALWARLGRRDFFQKYEILERVGQGGQGEIYKVRDFEFRRLVAMKRLSPEGRASAPMVYRFLAEAQIASQLEHPGVLPIFDVGLDPDGRPFYTTQLLPGTSLADVWRRTRDPQDGEWTTRRGLELLARVCEVMAHAHSRGVIHRDLKPDNVLVGSFGDVRVIDWGSAHVRAEARRDFEEPLVALNQGEVETDRGAALRADAACGLTTGSSGQPITVLFTPPEILAGRGEEVGPETDIYSIGVMLYELLTGRPPYCGADGKVPEREELQAAILRGPPAPVRHMDRGVSRDLAAVCEKAMAYQKAARYRSMPALAEDIRAALETRPVSARKPGPMMRLQKWGQRNPGYVMLGGAALVLVSGAFFVARGLRAERDAARQVTALRSAELAARNGRWQEALGHLDEAEAGGYGDAVDLGLQRAEAWTVLAQPERSRDELSRLVRRSDLGSRRATVLLRWGEHEMFDAATGAQGIQHVREALALGLTGADDLFARGLLAESTPEALDLMHGALQLNSFHHGAHRHSLGLEFIEGHSQELEIHARVFDVLYPDDPSAKAVEAVELALQGNSAAAHARLAGMKSELGPDMLARLDDACRSLAALAAFCGSDDFVEAPIRQLLPHLQLFQGASVFSETAPADGAVPQDLRLPQLPCVKRGLLEAGDGLKALAVPFLVNGQAAIDKVKSGWRHHPEASMPVWAAFLLENRHPPEGPKSQPVLQAQADLLQLGADSSSVIPNMPRMARYLAARVENELARGGATNADSLRAACRRNVRRAALDPDATAAQCRAWHELAVDLEDYDSARVFLGRWQRLEPASSQIQKLRRQLRDLEDADRPGGTTR